MTNEQIVKTNSVLNNIKKKVCKILQQKFKRFKNSDIYNNIPSILENNINDSICNYFSTTDGDFLDYLVKFMSKNITKNIAEDIKENKNYRILDELIENTIKKGSKCEFRREQIIRLSKIMDFLTEVELNDDKEILEYFYSNEKVSNCLSKFIEYNNLSLDDLEEILPSKAMELIYSYMITKDIELGKLDKSETTENSTTSGRVLTENIIKYKTMPDGMMKTKLGEQIFAENSKLIYKIANKFLWSNLELDDLYQEGCIGLLRAIEAFDGKSSSFSTYSYWWIYQGITRAIHQTNTAIRLPEHTRIIKEKIRVATYALETKLNREPTLEELSKYTSIPVTKIKELKLVPEITRSVNETIGVKGDEYSEMINFIPDGEMSIEEIYEAKAMHQDIMDTLDKLLDERSKFIIIKRYGIDGKRKLTLEELASILSITRERVRQIETKSLEMLKNSDCEHKLKLQEYIASTEKNSEVVSKKQRKYRKFPKVITSLYDYYESNGYTKDQLDSVIKTLTQKDLDILYMKYGLGLFKKIEINPDKYILVKQSSYALDLVETRLQRISKEGTLDLGNGKKLKYNDSNLKEVNLDALHLDKDNLSKVKNFLESEIYIDIASKVGVKNTIIMILKDGYLGISFTSKEVADFFKEEESTIEKKYQEISPDFISKITEIGTLKGHIKENESIKDFILQKTNSQNKV